ncbi:MAG TPA: YceI family protein [Anaeromyxobacter sp.]|nr:YceI family protein [Anaeromyxobacter sp.]
MKRLAVVLSLSLAPLAALAEPTTWAIDTSHTQSMFTVRHLVVSNVRGQFDKTTGTVTLDDKDVTKSSVEATIDAKTINTRDAKRDEHLRAADFFDVANHPTITFKSTKVEKAGEDKLKVSGNLTMRGVTKPVVLEVELPAAVVKDPWGNTRKGFVATTKVNRQDYGLKWNKAVEAGPVVGDEIKIEIEGELIQQAPKTSSAK